MRTKTIRVILVDGTPYGVRTVELSNWNGKVIISPRAGLSKLKTLPENNMPAVYLLLGDDRKVYVGESDMLGSRLARHAISKEFWSDLIAFTSPKLTKTEVRYLEHAFAKRLKADGLAVLENSVEPKSPNISQEDQDAMEEFVDRASDILLSLGFSLLGASHDAESAAKTSGRSVVCVGPDANARGVFGENGLLVLKGSFARKQQSPTFPTHHKRLRERMLSSGILKIYDAKTLIFDQDYLFPSPSAAAGIVLARSANGWTEWETEDGKTLKELEQRTEK